MQRYFRTAISLLVIAIMMVSLGACSSDSKLIKTTTISDTTASTVEVLPDAGIRESSIAVVKYKTTDYTSKKKTSKKMAVYIPEGYSENQEYKVAIALHVLGEDEKFWLKLGIKDIMDELISSGKIEPTLVFMPNDCLENAATCQTNEEICNQFSQELRNDLIPYIKDNFSVSESRDDYGCIGASLGAYMTVNCALCTNLDLFSNFGSIGGGVISHWKLDSDWEEFGTENLNINMLYIGQGMGDNKDPIEQGYKNLKAECSKLDDSNLKLSLIEKAGHDSKTWTTGFSEAIQLFFGTETYTTSVM